MNSAADLYVSAMESDGPTIEEVDDGAFDGVKTRVQRLIYEVQRILLELQDIHAVLQD